MHLCTLVDTQPYWDQSRSRALTTHNTYMITTTTLPCYRHGGGGKSLPCDVTHILIYCYILPPLPPLCVSGAAVSVTCITYRDVYTLLIHNAWGIFFPACTRAEGLRNTGWIITPRLGGNSVHNPFIAAGRWGLSSDRRVSWWPFHVIHNHNVFLFSSSCLPAAVHVVVVCELNCIQYGCRVGPRRDKSRCVNILLTWLV